jgi:predicted nucleic acid-binding protein
LICLFTRVVAINEAVARVSLELIGQMTVRLPVVDALIAAAAKVQGATLVHRDRHFTAIPESEFRQVFLGAPR